MERPICTHGIQKALWIPEHQPPSHINWPPDLSRDSAEEASEGGGCDGKSSIEPAETGSSPNGQTNISVSRSLEIHIFVSPTLSRGSVVHERKI